MVCLRKCRITTGVTFVKIQLSAMVFHVQLKPIKGYKTVHYFSFCDHSGSASLQGSYYRPSSFSLPSKKNPSILFFSFQPFCLKLFSLSAIKKMLYSLKGPFFLIKQKDVMLSSVRHHCCCRTCRTMMRRSTSCCIKQLNHLKRMVTLYKLRLLEDKKEIQEVCA